MGCVPSKESRKSNRRKAKERKTKSTLETQNPLIKLSEMAVEHKNMRMARSAAVGVPRSRRSMHLASFSLVSTGGELSAPTSRSRSEDDTS